MRERGSGNRHDAEHTGMDILGKRKQDGLLLRSLQLFAENAPIERVDELKFGEISGKERRLRALHDCRGRRGVGIGKV